MELGFGYNFLVGDFGMESRFEYSFFISRQGRLILVACADRVVGLLTVCIPAGVKSTLCGSGEAE